MVYKIVIAGSGFAGMWAALAAARAAAIAHRTADVEISVVSRTPNLHIRPRLYEIAFEEMAPDLSSLFESVGVRHIAGMVRSIHADRREVDVLGADGEPRTISYDRLVLATGSTLFTPDLPGLKQYTFNVDQLSSAMDLQRHLQSLADRPSTPTRNTVVIAGGGFTGIETAADMPQRLRAVLGTDAAIRVIVLEMADAIGPDLGPGPRPVIEQALRELGIEVLTSTSAVGFDAGGVDTSTGRRIETNTVVWTAGGRANPLSAQIPGEHDRLGRVNTDRELRANGVQDIFVTGDMAFAATDDAGNHTVLSCQHALSLGRVAGHNAAAELLGLPTVRYSQPKYVTCLDLGPWGAVYTEGWDRQVKMVRDEAKSLKRNINTVWIYPPKPDREAAFLAADPAFVVVA